MLIISGLIVLALASLIGAFFLAREDEVAAKPVRVTGPAVQEVTEASLSIAALNRIDEVQPELLQKENEGLENLSYTELVQQIRFLQQRQQGTEAELLQLQEMVDKLKLGLEDKTVSGLSHS